MDAVKFMFAFVAIFGPFIYAEKLGMWCWAWVTIALTIIGYEIYGVFFSRKKKTISRQFWEFKDKNPGKAALCILGMIVFWTYLCLHLWFRI